MSKEERYVVNRIRLKELIEPIAQAFLVDENARRVAHSSWILA